MKNIYDYYLKKFCSVREVFEEPVLIGDHVYATNSYVALKVHKKYLDGQYRTIEEIKEDKNINVPVIAKIFEEPPKPSHGELIYKFTRKIADETIPASPEVCQRCGGEGFDHEGEFRGESIYVQCDHCDKGKVRAGQHDYIDYKPEGTNIDVRLAVPYVGLAIEALAAFGETAFNVHRGIENNGFHFNYSKGQIIVMPLSK